MVKGQLFDSKEAHSNQTLILLPEGKQIYSILPNISSSNIKIKQL